MKTMTEILTIPALGTDHEARRPKRTARWTTLAGNRGTEEGDDEDQDAGAAALLSAHKELIILLVK